MAKVYDAVLKLTSDPFVRGLERAEKQLKNFQGRYYDLGKQFNSVGKTLNGAGDLFTKVFTVPIVAGAGLSTMAFKEVDEALDTIITKTGATGSVAMDLEKSFKNIAGDTPADLQKIGDAIGEVNTQFGLVDKDLEDTSKKFIKFSEISGQDVSESAIKAKQAMEMYNLSANDLDGILDAVAKTSQDTGQSAATLFDAVLKGGPSLKSLNLGFAESVALMGSLEQSGLDSTKTFSYLSKAQVNFAKDGKTLQQGLKDIKQRMKEANSETEQLNILSKAFGNKGAVYMFDALKRGALDLDQVADATKNAMGAVDSTFEATIDPIDKLKTMFNQLMMAGSELFKASEGIWEPAIDGIISKVKEATEWFSGLSDEQKQGIVKMLGYVASIGPVLVIFGKLHEGIGKVFFKLSDFAKAIKSAGGIMKWITMPANIMLLKFALIAGAVFLVIKNWDKIKAKAEEIFPGIGAKISGLWDKIKVVFDLLITWGAGKLTEFMNFWKSTWESLSPFISTFVETARGVIDGLFQILNGIIDFITGVFTGNWSLAWEGIKGIFSGIFTGIKSIAKGTVNGIIDVVNSMISGVNQFSLPDWVPGIGGKGINIPLIPKFAKGTNFFKGGLAEINEGGRGEIVDLPRGSRIYPHDNSVKKAFEEGKSKGSNGNTINNITIPKLAEQVIFKTEQDMDVFLEKLVNVLKIEKMNKIKV